MLSLGDKGNIINYKVSGLKNFHKIDVLEMLFVQLGLI